MIRFALGSDEANSLTEAVYEACLRHGSVRCFGALQPEATAHQSRWTTAASEVASAIRDGNADLGILFCYTGTGVAMAANKFKGIRAALCVDKDTAIGARRWNNANVLVMSLRLTTPTVGKEILDGFLSASVDTDRETTACLEAMYSLDQTIPPPSVPPYA